jgi:hypothetical protein
MPGSSPGMTSVCVTQLHDLAAQSARVFPSTSTLSNQRAQGRPGARCTRGLVRKMHKEMRTRAYRFSGNTPAFPAQWFYGLLRALLGDRLSCHHRLTGLDPQNLTPASGRQNHTTSPYASAPFVKGASTSTASHRTFVTIASRPLSGETGEVIALICPTS